MKKIEDLFKAAGASVSDTFFRLGGGSVGFRIPIFQRKFAWDIKHIDRLMSDINEGLGSVVNDPESLTFIGTLIFTEEKVQGFDGINFSIVDGQQRISTLLLLTLILHEQITLAENEITKQIAGTPLENFVSQNVKRIKQALMLCFSGKNDPISNDLSAFFPRLIREECDTWSNKPGCSEYCSPIPNYIHSYLKHVLSNDSSPFEYKMKTSAEYDLFSRNLKALKENLAYGKFYGAEGSIFESTTELVTNKKFSNSIFPDFETDIKSFNKAFKSLNTAPVFARLVYLTSISSYLLDRVAVTRVAASEDKYAFEIFEALNTTGEPLTALETFKPIVSNFEDTEFEKQGGFRRSNSRETFTDIDIYLDKLGNSEAKQKESANIIVALALIIDGKKESLHLNSQRVYLRSLFEKMSSSKDKQNLVQQIGNVVDYKTRFWNEAELPNQLLREENREVVLFCLDFIRQMNTSMTIPILARFYQAYKNSGNFIIFADAVKATAAFLAIWRGFYGGTSQIDAFFRDIMSKGSKYIKEASPLKTGRKFNNKISSAEDLKQYYRSFLTHKEIISSDLWTDGILNQPLYSKSKVLCRFMLFLASHKALISPTTCLLTKGKDNSFIDYIDMV